MVGQLFPRSFKTEYLTAVRGEGVYIYDSDGRKYLDGCSGALICNLGHCVPEIIQAIVDQLHKIEFAHTSRWRSESIAEAAKEMASLAPEGMDYVWFTCGGSESVEAALKLTRQFFVERDGGESTKRIIISRWNSYHGSTIGTMGVGGSVPRRRIYAPLFYLAYSGMVDFVNAIFYSGSFAGVVMSIMPIFILKKARLTGDREPEWTCGGYYHPVIQLAICVLFLGAAFYAVFQTLGLLPAGW